MKKESFSPKDFLRLVAVYLGMLLLVVALPEGNATLGVVALGLYALASFALVGRIR